MTKHCHICGDRLIQSEEALVFHLKRFHAVSMQTKGLDKVFQRKIQPQRTTTRTKAQIVFDVEKLWGKAVFPEVKPWQAFEDTLKKAVA